MRHEYAALGLLLLARGASAGDDAKPPAPAQPVDVPGFWTADELRRIDEGLDVLNCTRKDLGFQKRPIDDPFRLPVVNQILDDPLSIGPVAAEWDAVARRGDVHDLLVKASQAVESLCYLDGRPGAYSGPQTISVDSAQIDISPFMRALADAGAEVAQAFRVAQPTLQSLLMKARDTQ